MAKKKDKNIVEASFELEDLWEQQAVQEHLRKLFEPDVSESNTKKLSGYLENKQRLKKFIERLLNVLPDQEKRIIQMKFWENLTKDEIGYELGLRTKKVELIIENALTRLRKHMIKTHPSNKENSINVSEIDDPLETLRKLQGLKI